MILLAILVLLIVVPVAEIAIVIQVGHWIGLIPTLVLLLVDALIGSMLVRSQGRAAWRRFVAALAEGRVPAREALDGGLVIFGGALLIAPGFLTDIIGAVFLAPPTRALLRRMIVRRAARGLWLGVSRRVGATAGPRRRPGAPPGGEPGGRAEGREPRPYDVEGQAIEIEHRDLPA